MRRPSSKTRSRLWVRDLDDAQAESGSVADLVRRLREHGDYWERVQKGRLQRVKRGLARLMQPFFKPQVPYNLMVAEHLGRIEVALDELRGELRELVLVDALAVALNRASGRGCEPPRKDGPAMPIDPGHRRPLVSVIREHREPRST